MVGIAGLTGMDNAAALPLKVQYQAQVAKLQKDAIDMQGDLALQLIESASTNAVGKQLDLRI